MIKTHLGNIGKEQLPIRPTSMGRGRRSRAGETTKISANDSFTRLPDGTKFQPHPLYNPSK